MGAGVLVKAGAAGEEVRRVVVVENDQDEYRLSVDKGEQSNDGPAAVSPISNPQYPRNASCCS